MNDDFALDINGERRSDEIMSALGGVLDTQQNGLLCLHFHLLKKIHH